MHSSMKTLLIAAAGSGLMAGAAPTRPSAASLPAGDQSLQRLGQLAGTQLPKHGCKGQNACKGQGGCSTGDHGCKGRNSCKGKGGCSTA